MKLDYFVACDYAITDSVGRTAAIGIFDSMRLASPIGENPYVLNRFYLAIKILGTLIEGTDHKFSLAVRLPSGAQIWGAQNVPLPFVTSGAFSSTSVELIIGIQGLVIPEAVDGDYRIELIVDDAPLGARTLHVTCPPRVQIPSAPRPPGKVH